MRPEYDVIVVGAGPGGAACALTLARKGVNVLMLEKAKVPGERNMTGGVLYGGFMGHYGLVNLIPGFESEAPVQRRIVSHEVDVLSEPDWEKGEYRYYRLNRNSLPSRLGLFNVELETGHDFSVLRRDFDQWFANKAVEGGAMLSTQTTAEGLLVENGSIAGVRTTGEELRAKLVIDCSGVTSNLVEMAGLREKLVPREVYHGIKHVYRLDPATIEQRFKVAKDEGKAILCLGKFMMGVGGGAFIYTNRDTLSVGLVVSMDSLVRALTEKFDTVGKALDVLEAFEGHPMVAELLEGAEMVEYSAHNIPKSYKSIIGKPYTDGYLVAGDALGAFVKIGPLIDGIRRSIASGIMAAETYLQADQSGSFSASNLSRYRDLLAPLYEDVNRSGRDSFVSESSFVYHMLPGVLFSSGLFSKKAKIKPDQRRVSGGDATRRVQLGTSILNYDEDKAYSHITVDLALASKSATKPWIPCCPVNCYSLYTAKGVFASYKDLYDFNLRSLEGKGAKVQAYRETLKDVQEGQVRFDHVACVACGTCGEIGPKEMVSFSHERDGHGVRYRFG
jgi:electron transfer flavoprotein-quinone oxidoreductase